MENRAIGVFIKNYSKVELIKRLFYDLKPDCVGLLSELDMVNLTTDVSLDKEEAYMEGYAKGVVYGSLLKDTPSENKCHRHGIRLEDGTLIYECIGCYEQDCERK